VVWQSDVRSSAPPRTGRDGWATEGQSGQRCRQAAAVAGRRASAAIERPSANASRAVAGSESSEYLHDLRCRAQLSRDGTDRRRDAGERLNWSWDVLPAKYRNMSPTGVTRTKDYRTDLVSFNSHGKLVARFAQRGLSCGNRRAELEIALFLRDCARLNFRTTRPPAIAAGGHGNQLCSGNSCLANSYRGRWDSNTRPPV
jgi:hypothetical protein